MLRFALNSDMGNLITLIRDRTQYNLAKHSLSKYHHDQKQLSKAIAADSGRRAENSPRNSASRSNQRANPADCSRHSKGIDLYKKQQKEKARDLNRRLKKLSTQKQQSIEPDDPETQLIMVYRQHWLPWLLLLLTWLAAGIYFLV